MNQIQYPEGFGLWDDENAPEVAYNAAVYCVRFPHKLRMKLPTGILPFVYLQVDTYGWVEITGYSWFGANSSDGRTWGVQKEILEYLQEWEYVELKAIGPEDSEWFATEKLLSLPQTNYWKEVM